MMRIKLKMAERTLQFNKCIKDLEEKVQKEIEKRETEPKSIVKKPTPPNVSLATKVTIDDDDQNIEKYQDSKVKKDKGVTLPPNSQETVEDKKKKF